jgi:hypothetical protein
MWPPAVDRADAKAGGGRCERGDGAATAGATTPDRQRLDKVSLRSMPKINHFLFALSNIVKFVFKENANLMRLLL